MDPTYVDTIKAVSQLGAYPLMMTIIIVLWKAYNGVVTKYEDLLIKTIAAIEKGNNAPKN